MNPNKNHQPAQNAPAAANANGNAIPYFNAFTVEEYETSAGKSGKRWTKVGVAFPHKDGTGFNIELRALPLDGRLVLLLPQDGEDTDGRETAAPRAPTRR